MAPSRLTKIAGVFVLASALAAASAHAQKPRPMTQGPDADSDGVTDAQDRCANTPVGTRVTRFGCALALLRPGQNIPGAARADTAAAPDTSSARGPKGRRASPVLLTPGRLAARRDSIAAARRDSVAAASPGVVAPQATGRAAAAEPPTEPQPAAAAAATFTAGVGMPAPGSMTHDAYLRRFVRGLDSAVVLMIEVFRNTTGQPMAGAGDPSALSQRERDRWARCRAVHWDLTTYAGAMEMVTESLPESPSLERAAGALDSSLTAMETTAECDNIASMISAPERWTPWGPQYETAARAFYGAWYGQLRDVHERHRAFVIAVNAALPANRRMPVPPGLQRNPPYAGAAPR